MASDARRGRAGSEDRVHGREADVAGTEFDTHSTRVRQRRNLAQWKGLSNAVQGVFRIRLSLRESSVLCRARWGGRGLRRDRASNEAHVEGTDFVTQSTSVRQRRNLAP